MKRYYIANSDGIPFHEQPNNGYTYLQVINRVQREIKECIDLYGGTYNDYKEWFIVFDNNFNEVKEAKTAF